MKEFCIRNKLSNKNYTTYRVLALDEHVNDVGAQQVAVLVQEVADLVGDLAGVVPDEEEALAGARPPVQAVGAAAVHEVALLEEGEVARLGQVALVVEQVQEAVRLLGDQVEAGPVVLVVDGRPVQALLRVLLLLQPEDVPVEVELERLVGVVDAQLLEPVHREILSAATQKKRSVKPIRWTR